VEHSGERGPICHEHFKRIGKYEEKQHKIMCPRLKDLCKSQQFDKVASTPETFLALVAMLGYAEVLYIMGHTLWPNS
jgi:hypothetical protein